MKLKEPKPTDLAGNYSEVGNGGGNSGAVISPAPGLGLSAYQDANHPVKKLPKRQGL
jgi:hypothetical protein